MADPLTKESLASTVRELLALDDGAFIDNTYKTLLGRAPDDAGRAHYLDFLRLGGSKRQVVLDLYKSKERRSFGSTIQGISQSQILELIERLPFRISYFRRIRRIERLFEMYSSQTVVAAGDMGVSSVYDLFGLWDEDFVRAAYLSILHREVDDDGLAYYLLRLRGGIDRRYILADLARSDEGKKANLVGLQSAIRSIKPFGKLSRIFGRRKPRVVAQILALQNMQYVQDKKYASHFQQISRQLVEFQKTIGSAPSPARSALQQQVLDRGSKMGRMEFVKDPSKPVRAILFYVDHTINCPANTGMQRVVRQLARGLVENGETVRFVKWLPIEKRFALIDKAELNHLSQWNGPQVSASDRNVYPDKENPDNRVDIDGIGRNFWFFQPEVSHITYHDVAPTVEVFLAARALGANIAAIYYDAIPLRLPAYNAGLEAHEKYMQALILVDLIIPISNRSENEIKLFLTQHQSAKSGPQIRAISLPGETNLSKRVVSSKQTVEKVILSVGSLEPRKNHARLLEAFLIFSEIPGNGDWSLVLAGNMHEDVAPIVDAAVAKNSKIQYVRHPSDADLDGLYRAAYFTVFPSTEEGFGLPILESIWYGVPCVCANFGAMQEVAAEGGTLTVNTRSVDEITQALVKMSTDTALYDRLKAEATTRHIKTWNEYSQEVVSLLDQTEDRARRLCSMYYWVNDTSVQPFNTGIQRVVRQTARALMEKGVELIPVLWDHDKKCIFPASDDHLSHLAKWNGPKTTSWGKWKAPRTANSPKWLMVPEVVHLYLGDVIAFAKEKSLRHATIFYDAIPFKARDLYSQEWHDNHRNYMLCTGEFDKIFAISRTSFTDLWNFLLSTPKKTSSVDHRLRTIPLACELAGEERNLLPKRHRSHEIRLLAVGSLEPRKNQLILLEAFARASAISEKRLFLKIVGNSSLGWPAYLKEFEQRISTIADCEWLSGVDDEGLAKLYLEADLCVYPSVEEGFGLPIVESIWNGRCCIVHEAGAMAEIAEGGGCVSVDMTDVDALTDAILELSEDDALRRDLSRQATSRDLRTWSQYANDIIAELASDRLIDNLSALESSCDDVYSELPELSRRPLLSLCISTYNRAEWLSVNLNNIFAQPDIEMLDVEVLVVDNTSTDNTEEVVKPFQNIKNFRYVRNVKNVGMLGNLTVTAHEARGDYVWILGDDDLIRKEALPKVLKAIRENSGVALVYPNYAFTFETNPEQAIDIETFLESCPPIIPAGPDLFGSVRDVAVKNENLFTAIYALILRRDHALRAYSQDTSGRDFSSMRTAIPTTYYVLNYMMDEPAYWIGDPIVVVNFNVSWNKYASLFILERFPEAHDLAERLGADPREIDRWRAHFMPGFPHWWNEIMGADPAGNAEYFAADRVVMRVKHLKEFNEMSEQLRNIYRHALVNGHAAATIPTEVLFSSLGDH